LSTGNALREADRVRIDRIGAIQSRVAVRLAYARAAQDLAATDEVLKQARFSAALLDTLLAESGSVKLEETRAADERLDRLDATASTQQSLVWALSLIGVLAAALFGSLTWRAVARPLARLTETARRMGAGDFRVDAPADDLDAEYRELATAFVETARRLAVLIGEIRQQAVEVTESAAALNAASEEAARATNQVSEVVGDIAARRADKSSRSGASRDVLGRVGDSAAHLGRFAERSTELGGTSVAPPIARTKTFAERSRHCIALARSSRNRQRELPNSTPRRKRWRHSSRRFKTSPI
jgi:methyl-accepting chemotaxis protein